jgi:hypothetical protein
MRLAFELALLERMMPIYRASILEELGLSDEEERRIRSECTLDLPRDLDRGLEIHTKILGSPLRSLPLEARVPDAFRGSIRNVFVLTLWPDLHWVVYSLPDERTWGAGFESQVPDQLASIGPAFDPAFVRPGVWTRPTLERLADRHALHDGWDEQVVIRFAFGARTYEGVFVFGLLQGWRRV